MPGFISSETFFKVTRGVWAYLFMRVCVTQTQTHILLLKSKSDENYMGNFIFNVYVNLISVSKTEHFFAAFKNIEHFNFQKI